jgi:hypothetical protein
LQRPRSAGKRAYQILTAGGSPSARARSWRSGAICVRSSFTSATPRSATRRNTSSCGRVGLTALGTEAAWHPKTPAQRRGVSYGVVADVAGSKEEDDTTYNRCATGHDPEGLPFDMSEQVSNPTRNGAIGKTITSVQNNTPATTRIIPAPLRMLSRNREVIHNLLQIPISGPLNTIAGHRCRAC